MRLNVIYMMKEMNMIRYTISGSAGVVDISLYGLMYVMNSQTL